MRCSCNEAHTDRGLHRSGSIRLGGRGDLGEYPLRMSLWKNLSPYLNHSMQTIVVDIKPCGGLICLW